MFTLALIPEWIHGISILHQEGYSKGRRPCGYVGGLLIVAQPSEKQEPVGQVF